MNGLRATVLNDLRVTDFGQSSPPLGYEKIWGYDKGGHHPVHLGDILHQQYKVLNKLNSGGFANVWLCSDISVDRPCYVALKIITAEISTPDCPESRVSELVISQGLSDELFCLPLDRFEIEGPNGLHYVFLYPVLGPNVACLPARHAFDQDGNAVAPKIPYQEICSQVAHAMAVLHEHGICHRGMFFIHLESSSYLFPKYTSDFRPANILARLSGLDSLGEATLLTIMETPRKCAGNYTRGGAP